MTSSPNLPPGGYTREIAKQLIGYIERDVEFGLKPGEICKGFVLDPPDHTYGCFIKKSFAAGETDLRNIDSRTGQSVAEGNLSLSVQTIQAGINAAASYLRRDHNDEYRHAKVPGEYLVVHIIGGRDGSICPPKSPPTILRSLHAVIVPSISPVAQQERPQELQSREAAVVSQIRGDSLDAHSCGWWCH